MKDIEEGKRRMAELAALNAAEAAEAAEAAKRIAAQEAAEEAERLRMKKLREEEEKARRSCIASLNMECPEWTLSPGEEGFNAEATRHFKAAGLYAERIVGEAGEGDNKDAGEDKSWWSWGRLKLWFSQNKKKIIWLVGAIGLAATTYYLYKQYGGDKAEIENELKKVINNNIPSNEYVRKNTHTPSWQPWELAGGNGSFSIHCPKKAAGEETVYQPMAYQQTVPFLVHPKSPVNRMLVAHRTGSGKTFTMLLVLDNFFADPRSKVVIFPTESVKNNFYSEMLKFPNKYRDAYMKAKRLKTQEDLEAYVKTCSERNLPENFLSTKCNLRAFRYTIAGGRTVIRQGGAGRFSRPTNPFFSKGFANSPSWMPYNKKIVLMDEVHNLVTPSAEVERYQEKLDNLKHQMRHCRGSVVLGFTATPMKDKRSQGEELLDIIKGEENRGKNNEGFVSWFNSMPRSTYPETRPCVEKYLGNVVKVVLQGTNAKDYAKKHKEAKKRKDGTFDHRTLHRLQNYCNGPWKDQWKKLKNRFSPENAKKHATKLYHIAHSVATSDKKCLIVVHRTAGYHLMAKMMESIVKNECGPTPDGGCWVGLFEKGKKGSQEKKRVESMIARFNDYENNGKTMKAMVIDAKEFSEGVNFKGVRRLILVNPPIAFSEYKQRVGRALRSCDRPLYAAEERNVDIDIYVATHPSVAKTADEIALEKIEGEKQSVERDLNELFRDVAVDREVLEPVAVVSDGECVEPQNRVIGPHDIALPATTAGPISSNPDSTMKTTPHSPTPPSTPPSTLPSTPPHTYHKKLYHIDPTINFMSPKLEKLW